LTVVSTSTVLRPAQLWHYQRVTLPQLGDQLAEFALCRSHRARDSLRHPVVDPQLAAGCVIPDANLLGIEFLLVRAHPEVCVDAPGPGGAGGAQGFPFTQSNGAGGGRPGPAGRPA